MRWPASLAGTSPPSSSTILASQPGTSVPMLPGRTHPGRLEITMWHSSVEPSPSTISTPNRSIHRSYNALGRGSPAETPQRSDARSYTTSPASAARSMAGSGGGGVVCQKRQVVLGGGGGVELGDFPRHELLDGEAFRGHGVSPLGHAAVHDHDRGARVVQHVLDLRRARQGIQGNR